MTESVNRQMNKWFPMEDPYFISFKKFIFFTF